MFSRRLLELLCLLLMLSFFRLNPGHSLDPRLGSMERGAVPGSGPNPLTYIPRHPPTKAGQSDVVGHRVAPSLWSPKKASAGPPAAPMTQLLLQPHIHKFVFDVKGNIVQLPVFPPLIRSDTICLLIFLVHVCLRSGFCLICASLFCYS